MAFLSSEVPELNCGEVKPMIEACLLGLGRTGIVVAEQLLTAEDFNLAAVFSRPHSTKEGHPLSKYARTEKDLTIKSTTSLLDELKIKKINVAIDFTSAEAALANAYVLAENGVNVVIGTTGFNNMQVYELKSIAQKYKIGMVYAPNISLGINLLLNVVKTITGAIPEYDVEITESHHRQKKDNPSGTALKIANAIAEIKDGKSGHFVHGRKGIQSRQPGEIGIHAIRAGGIVGVHKVLFAGEFDEIEITHRSNSRLVFAQGALEAARFIQGKRGFYSMEDVLFADGESHDGGKKTEKIVSC